MTRVRNTYGSSLWAPLKPLTWMVNPAPWSADPDTTLTLSLVEPRLIDEPRSGEPRSGMSAKPSAACEVELVPASSRLSPTGEPRNGEPRKGEPRSGDA